MNKALCSSLIGFVTAILSHGQEGIPTLPSPAELRKDHVTVTISPPNAGCQIVTFPEPWRYPDGLPHRPSFLTWRASQKVKNVLYIASTDELATSISINKYRVRVGERISLEPAPEAEWSSAIRLLRQYRPTDEDAPMGFTKDRTAIHRKGKLFPKTGKTFSPASPALISPGHQYIAIQSFDGMYPGPPKTMADLHGTMYVDIFSCTSGAKVVSVQAKFSNTHGALLSGGAAWYPPGLLSLDYMLKEKRSVILCHFKE